MGEVNTIATEIERKFTFKKKPKADPDTPVIKQKIHQTYLSVERGQSNLRVRKIIEGKNTSYTMTYKEGKGMAKKEVEFPIDKKTYNQMIRTHNAKPLIKNRTKMYVEGYLCEFDKYTQDANRGIEVVEIEFNSIKEAEKFKMMKWMKDEVSNDSSYGNITLWKKVQKKNKK